MNVILASTSTLYVGKYLDYLQTEIEALFSGVEEIIFIPYARPGGISHDDYTKKAVEFFSKMNIKVKGLHTFSDKNNAIENAKGFFTGGGNTFLLVKNLHDENLMSLLKDKVSSGVPYLGCSAGSNIGGISMKTTNDMPIVHPKSFDCMGLVPFHINPHYLDPDPLSRHNGETRETRILEFLTQNKSKVIGLREGNWIRIAQNTIRVEGTESTRVFENDKMPYEIAPGTILS